MIAGMRRLVELFPDSMTDRLNLVYRLASVTGSEAPMVEALDRMTPQERESGAGIELRQRLAADRDYAEFKRLDALRSGREQREDPVIVALEACAIFIMHGEKHLVAARLGELPDGVRTRLARNPANLTLRSQLALIEARNGDPKEAVRLARGVVADLPVSRDPLNGSNLPVRARTLARG